MKMEWFQVRKKMKQQKKNKTKQNLCYILKFTEL